MYGYVITKADPSNLEYVGRSAGRISKDDILKNKLKIEFICLSQRDTGFIRGFYLNDTFDIDFEPLDYFQDEVGFTSMYYFNDQSKKWHEL